MKILHLTLRKKWFYKIASGQKKNEYREIKQYWKTRLFKDGRPIKFDEIHFTNGYGKDRPFMRVEWLGCTMLDYVFDIQLGKILEIRQHQPQTSKP